MTLAEDTEILNLRAIAGEYDLQERHIDLGKLPVIIENQKKGNYNVRLDTAPSTAPTRRLQINQSFDADPEIAKWLRQRRLPPRAVAGYRPQPAQRDVLARRRHAGLGGAGRGRCPISRGRSGARKWSTLRSGAGQRAARRDRAHEKGREGFRLRTDNGERLRIQIQAVQGVPALAGDQAK